MKNVTVVDDLLSEQDCKDLISWIEVSAHLAEEWMGSYNVGVKPDQPYLGMLVQDVIDKAREIKPDAVFDWGYVTVRPPGVDHIMHVDDGKNDTALTSITYLNEDYDGGLTFFENGEVYHPKIGRTIFFDGAKHAHGVSEVQRSNRFTLALWYK